MSRWTLRQPASPMPVTRSGLGHSPVRRTGAGEELAHRLCGNTTAPVRRKNHQLGDSEDLSRGGEFLDVPRKSPREVTPPPSPRVREESHGRTQPVSSGWPRARRSRAAARHRRSVGGTAGGRRTPHPEVRGMPRRTRPPRPPATARAATWSNAAGTPLPRIPRPSEPPPVPPCAAQGQGGLRADRPRVSGARPGTHLGPTDGTPAGENRKFRRVRSARGRSRVKLSRASRTLASTSASFSVNDNTGQSATRPGAG